MRKLIDNMLFLAQGDAGQTPAIQIPVHFSELAWSVLLQFEPIAYEKQIELDSDIQPGLYIKGDTTQLKQLIHIFLDNGCKYAGQHGQGVFAAVQPAKQCFAVRSQYRSGYSERRIAAYF